MFEPFFEKSTMIITNLDRQRCTIQRYYKTKVLWTKVLFGQRYYKTKVLFGTKSDQYLKNLILEIL